MTNAPERIWLDWPDANRGGIVYNEPPERDTQPGQTEYIRADLCQPKVKPLVWVDRGYEWAWWADTVFGKGAYQIRCEDGIGYLLDLDGVTLVDPHGTLEAAQAAAQADYTARILAALDLHKQLFEAQP